VLRIEKRTVPMLDLAGVSRRQGGRVSFGRESPGGCRQKDLQDGHR
jgi:hypothetical protein